jgi:glycerol uptake facilitator-like aquaporin
MSRTNERNTRKQSLTRKYHHGKHVIRRLAGTLIACVRIGFTLFILIFAFIGLYLAIEANDLGQIAVGITVLVLFFALLEIYRNQWSSWDSLQIRSKQEFWGSALLVACGIAVIYLHFVGKLYGDSIALLLNNLGDSYGFWYPMGLYILSRFNNNPRHLHNDEAI